MSEFAQMESVLAGATVAGPAMESMISDAEGKLGVSFPPSYRFFLEKFGAALCDGFELAGLFASPVEDEPPLWVDVVASTLRLRRASKEMIPQEYVAVSGDGGDFTYYIDTKRRRPDGESPIVALGPGVDSVAIAETFSDYVIRATYGGISF